MGSTKKYLTTVKKMGIMVMGLKKFLDFSLIIREERIWKIGLNFGTKGVKYER